jgi:hypothetical protein
VYDIGNGHTEIFRRHGRPSEFCSMSWLVHWVATEVRVVNIPSPDCIAFHLSMTCKKRSLSYNRNVISEKTNTQ